MPGGWQRKRGGPDYVANPALAGKGPEAYAAVLDPSATPWVWERQPFHEEGAVRHVLFLDGRVKRLRESDWLTIQPPAGPESPPGKP